MAIKVLNTVWKMYCARCGYSFTHFTEKDVKEPSKMPCPKCGWLYLSYSPNPAVPR